MLYFYGGFDDSNDLINHDLLSNSSQSSSLLFDLCLRSRSEKHSNVGLMGEEALFHFLARKTISQPELEKDVEL